jgi:rhodanese-related sulfurtransferase
MKKIIIPIVILLIFVVVDRGTTEMFSNATRISATEAREKMRANPNAIILDVRTAQEFATGKIPGAILLPDFAIREQATQVLPDKNALILVYCRSGARSREATYELISMGYTNVFDFGGINSWPYERN